MTTQNPANFTIASYNAENQGKTGYVGLAADGCSLVLKTLLDTTTTWTLTLNVAAGAATAGFSLFNAAGTGGNQSAFAPADGIQIALNDDPTPFGVLQYCWTLWPTNTWQGLQLWTIQDYKRGGLMDAENGGSDDGTRVLLWGSGVGNNQQWILRTAQ